MSVVESNRSSTPRQRDRSQAGVALITTLVAMVALLAISSLAIDGGMLWAARTQVQNAADAAALAAGLNLIDPDTPAVTLSSAESAAISQAGENEAISTPAIGLLPADISYGDWDLATRSFDTAVDLTDPEQVTAVEVVARLDDSTTGRAPAFLSRILGRDGFEVRASATAYLGYAGGILPGTVELPIAIDCCKLKGASCNHDYCTTVSTNPPNSCSLEHPQLSGDNTVSCLEFHNTSEQNACWTAFDGQAPGVNTSDLVDIVHDGNEVQISTDEPIYVDNGDKTPVIGEISDRFLGEGAHLGNAQGTDRYANPVGQSSQPDSWVVALPVVECQSDTHCAGGHPAQVVGAVCFEIREITVVPDKIIRGRFLCREDPLFEECDLGLTRSGGLDFGIRADIPVLVR
jgi:Flp pilus assembly protein TadG